jgi:endogenous inhibitor of DNA gyrase (YacG/DUF329 family)
MSGKINKQTFQVVFVILLLGFYVIMFAQQQTLKTAQQTPFNQEAALAKLREQIKGKEKEPAEQVFKNIQLLKGVPSGNLLKIMELGYSRSLGVDCTHCHVPDEWEKESKTAKQITRDMVGMMKTINTELLKNIKNLNNATPTVNCTTCHRGQVKPALNLPLPSSPSPTPKLPS